MNLPYGPPLQVLIVEDCADTADSLALLLRLWGHESRIARTGAAALALAAEQRPDVVLLDVGLPDVDGLELIARLRELSGVRQSLIVVVSGFGQPGDCKRSREAGADAFYIKPADPKVLCALLAARQIPGASNDDRTADELRPQP